MFNIHVRNNIITRYSIAYTFSAADNYITQHRKRAHVLKTTVFPAIDFTITISIVIIMRTYYVLL